MWSLAFRLDRINRKVLDETISANPAIKKRGPAQDLNDTGSPPLVRFLIVRISN